MPLPPSEPDPRERAGGRPLVQPSLAFIGPARLIRADGTAALLARNDAALLLLIALETMPTRRALAPRVWPGSADPLNTLRQRLLQIKRSVGAALLLAERDEQLRLALPHDLSHPGSALAAAPASLVGDLLEGWQPDPLQQELAAWIDGRRAWWLQWRSQILDRLAEQHEAAAHWDRALPYRLRRLAEDPWAVPPVAALMRLHLHLGDFGAAVAVHEAFLARLDHDDGAALRAHGSAAARPRHAMPGSLDELESLRRQAERAAQGTTPEPRAQPSPPALQHPPLRVGRQAQWTALEHARVSHRAALVLGVAGMGKSRLLNDFGASLDPGAMVRVHASVLDGDRSYALLARLVQALLRGRNWSHAAAGESRAQLARLAPELGSPAAGAERPELYARALLDLSRSNGVRVWVVDDLHFSDDASVAVLAAVLAQPAATERPWLLLAARTGEVPTPLQRFIDGGDTGLQRVELQALPAGPVMELVQSIEGARPVPQDIGALLHLRSGGNPLFVLEMMRAVWDGHGFDWSHMDRAPMPSHVTDLQARRLGRLSGPAQQLAQVAALAGHALDAELAAAVLQTTPLALSAAWAELERMQVLAGTDFVHDLLRDACLGGVPSAIARSMHARIAEHLAARSPAPDPARLARHWSAAERWSEAAAAHEAAARAAQLRRRRADELLHWECAAEAHARAGDLSAARCCRAEALEPMLTVRGIPATEAALVALRREPLPEAARLAVSVAQVTTLMLSSRFGEAAPLIREALDRLGPAEAEPRRRHRLIIAQAQALQVSGQPAQAMAILEAQWSAVAALGDPEVEYEHLAAKSWLLRNQFKREAALPYYGAALDIATRLGDAQEQMTMLSNRAIGCMELGRFDEAVQDALAARRLHEHQGDVQSVPMAVSELHLGLMLAGSGRLGEALSVLESSVRRFEAAGGGFWSWAARLNLAKVLLICGDVPRARRLLGTPGSQDDEGWLEAAPMHSMGRLLLLAQLSRWTGDRATRLLERIRVEAERADPRVARPLADIEIAQHEAPAVAVQRLDRAVEQLTAVEHRAYAQAARALRVERLLELDPSAAYDAALECQAAGQRVHAGLGQPSVWRACARAFEARGETGRLREVLLAFTDWHRRATAAPLPPRLAQTMKERNRDLAWLFTAITAVD